MLFIFIEDLERANISIDSFIPARFRLSTLFGYKSKMVSDGLYEAQPSGQSSIFIKVLALTTKANCCKRNDLTKMAGISYLAKIIGLRLYFEDTITHTL